MNIETVKTDDLSCRFFRFGNRLGQPFVIIPGIALKSVMDSAELIARQYAQLSEFFDIYLIDRREDMPAEYSVYDMADDTAKVMYSIGIRNAVIYGVSQGGMIAQLIAAGYPDLAGRLIVCSTAPCLQDTAADKLRIWADCAEQRDIPGLIASFAENVYSQGYYDKYRDAFAAFGSMITNEDLERFLVMVKGTKDFDIRDKLEGIRCPVLVIAGGKDRIFGTAPSEEIARITGGKLLIYENDAHSVYDENPDVTEQIMAFCR